MREAYSLLVKVEDYEGWWSDFFEAAINPVIRQRKVASYLDVKETVDSVRDLSSRLAKQMQRFENLRIADSVGLIKRADLVTAKHVQKYAEVVRGMDTHFLSMLGSATLDDASLAAYKCEHREYDKVLNSLSVRTTDVLAALQDDAEYFLEHTLPELRRAKSTRATEAIRHVGCLLFEFVERSTDKKLSWSAALGYAVAIACEVIIDDPDVLVTYEMTRQCTQIIIAR